MQAAASSASVVRQGRRSSDLLEQVGVVAPGSTRAARSRTGCTSLDRHGVGPAAGAGVHDEHLLLDRDRRVLRLLEQLGQAVAAVELGLRDLVQLGAERRERLQLAELRQVELQRAGRPSSSP